MKANSLHNIKNSTGNFYFNHSFLSYINTFCRLADKHPFILKPFKGMSNEIRDVLMTDGFELYPTVEKTTLFYNRNADAFFKILHPISLKHRIISMFVDRAGSIYYLSEALIRLGFRIPKVEAYGIIRNGRKVFFITKRVDGKSLYDLLIKRKSRIDMEIYMKVMDEIINLHKAGYWLGDAHLSHIFVKNNEISGFIDLDSIRKNRISHVKNYAKDIAGLNHRELPLSEKDKNNIWSYYMNKMNLNDRKSFVNHIKNYSEKRWKA